MTPPLPNEDGSREDICGTDWSTDASVFTAKLAVDQEAVPDVLALPHPHIGWAVLWMFAFWTVQIVVGIVVAAAAMAVAVAQGQSTAKQIELALADVSVVMIPIGTLFSALTAITITSIFYRRAFRIRLALRGMAWPHWVGSLLAVLPLAVIASEVTNCAGEVLPSFNAEVLGQFAASPWPMVFVAACLLPAIGEEIFCRGFLGRGLVAHHGAFAGALLASLLFGIMHIDPVQSVGAFVLGLALHFIYLTTRSLFAPMLVHMLNNAFAFWVMRNYRWCPLPGLSPLPDRTEVHTPLSVMIAAVAASAGLLGLLYQTRARWIMTSSDSQDGAEVAWSPGYVTAEQPPSGIGCHAATAPMRLWLAAFAVLSYGALLAALILESQAVSAP
ncbi:MAG: CPBP family intramembrane metalloprotease [Planctomycetes bacterium]|nr:CPBP family intramembrane metalloprotease [Planctomycetota bacterium]